MASKIIPQGDHVFVLDIDQKKVLGGIELPDNMKQQDMQIGLIACVGPDVAERFVQNEIVAYGPYAGKVIVIDGVAFRSLRAGQIECKIAKDVDPVPEVAEAEEPDDPFRDVSFNA